MSDVKIKATVVADTSKIKSNIEKIKPVIRVQVDTSALRGQVEKALSQAAANSKPLKINYAAPVMPQVMQPAVVPSNNPAYLTAPPTAQAPQQTAASSSKSPSGFFGGIVGAASSINSFIGQATAIPNLLAKVGASLNLKNGGEPRQLSVACFPLESAPPVPAVTHSEIKLKMVA